MAPGLDYYLIKFKFEGYWYFWDDRVEGYFNFTTQKIFKKIPVGAAWTDDCWVSQWRLEDEENDNEFY